MSFDNIVAWDVIFSQTWWKLWMWGTHSSWQKKDACNGQSILSMCINAHLNATMLAYGFVIDSCNKNCKPKKT